MVSSKNEFLKKSAGLNVKNIIIPYSRPIIREKKAGWIKNDTHKGIFLIAVITGERRWKDRGIIKPVRAPKIINSTEGPLYSLITKVRRNNANNAPRKEQIKSIAAIESILSFFEFSKILTLFQHKLTTKKNAKDGNTLGY